MNYEEMDKAQLVDALHELDKRKAEDEFYTPPAP